MKYIFCFFCVLCFPACTLIGKYIKPVQPQKSRISQQNKTIKKDLPKPTKQSAEYQLIKQAKKQLASRPLSKQQVKGLKQILKNKEESLKDPARTLLGRHFFQNSSYKKALFYYTKVQADSYKKIALLQSAHLYHRLNQNKKALKLISHLTEEEELTDRELREIYSLKLNIISQSPTDSQTEIFKTYCQILTYDMRPNTSYRKKARQILFNMKEKEVLSLKSEGFIEPLKDLVFFRTGQILLEREKFRRAKRFFKNFLRSSRDSTLEKQALKYIQAIESRKKVNKRHIGAILPLSGPNALIGKKSLQGLKMGLGFLNKQEKTHFQLIALNSQGQADRVKKAVQQLVMQHNVIAIVGGALSRTARALAQEAQNFSVPAVLISQKSGLTKIGHYIFQNGLTARLMADQLTDFLMNKLSARHFALLYPNDPYGVNYANAFWSAVEQKGGQITGAQFYKPGETDFNGPLRRLIGLYYLKDREKEYEERLKEWYKTKVGSQHMRGRLPENILPPIVKFDILFVPDSLKALSLIAPHLSYNDIKHITLAGTSLWNNKNMLKTTVKHTKGIIVADIGLNTPSFQQSRFYTNFVRFFGRKPGLFELQSYESALALRQVILSGASDRNELRKKLAQLKTFHGPMGEMVLSKTREFQRPLEIFIMKNKGLDSSVSL